MSEGERHTVLVLGAGASAPYGFPTGFDLVRSICKEFKDYICHTHAGAAASAGDRQKALDFSEALDGSASFSVDAFLESRTSLRDLGKTAIACVLLPKERRETLSNVGDPNKDNWYQHLFNWLFPKPSPEVPPRNVSILTYNYDRSLEQYFYHGLKYRWELEDAAVDAILSGIPIIHMHGSFGPLPWQSASGKRVPYGWELVSQDADAVVAAANTIKIIFESDIVMSDALKKAHVALGTATEVLFFGFGYDETNLRRLLARNPFAGRKVALNGTAYKLTDVERKEKEKILRQLLPDCTVDLLNRNNVDFVRNTRWFLQK